ncbi:MAG: hypothetical protein KAT16_07705 [Candidatus Heimdallarchaeota archaeon]|nr:hypothetical protein [Candidatus Heimdallarchaeota archaeon]
MAYQVTSDGHWDPVAFSRRNLKAKEVFIIVDDERREIWIWIGMQASVKTRFISSTAATEIRRHYGLTYRVKTADQGDEPQNFLDCINSIPKNGIVPELDDSRTQSKLTTDTSSLTTKKTAPKKKVRKTTAKSKARKTPTKTTSSTTKKSPTKKITPKKTTPRKGAPKKTSSKKSISEQKAQKSLNGYFSASTDVITTPPCPECKNGHLLPYSQRIEEKGKEVFVLPFAKWFCSSCNYSPSSSD